jgi:hypothetical protein
MPTGTVFKVNKATANNRQLLGRLVCCSGTNAGMGVLSVFSLAVWEQSVKRFRLKTTTPSQPVALHVWLPMYSAGQVLKAKHKMTGQSRDVTLPRFHRECQCCCVQTVLSTFTLGNSWQHILCSTGDVNPACKTTPKSWGGRKNQPTLRTHKL